MTLENLKNQIFVAVVVDNADPKKMGRCKCKVLNIFDEIPTEDIPWAKPWKDLNGNQFILPDVGKVVSVVFDSGNPYKPEYIYADHYNSNLQDKLSKLSDESYKSMRALMFDDKTQIFSNDEDGLIVDYKFNNINIHDAGINVNLKDNYATLNLGDANSDQQVILGTNFLNWFDEFLENLVGDKSGPYLGNLGAPVVAHPALIEVVSKYREARDPDFLSKHVYVTSNDVVTSVSDNVSNRSSAATQGDSFSTTSKELDSIPRGAVNGAPDFSPSVDPNLAPQTEAGQQAQTPTTNPAYIDETIGPNSGIVAEFAKELVRVGMQEIGIREVPLNSNRGPRVREYQAATSLGKDQKYLNQGFAWCAAFVTWCFSQVAAKGIKYSFKLPKTAGAFDYENWAKANRSFVDIINSNSGILPGDIIIFTFSHIGIAISKSEGDRFRTVEGNTDTKGSREGGGVYEKSRKTSSVRSVLRIKFNTNMVQ